MKRIKTVTLAAWIANTLDSEDSAIRIREGLPLPRTPLSFIKWERTALTDYERLTRAYSRSTSKGAHID